MSCGSGRGGAPGATARAEIHATTRDSSLFRRGPPAEVRLVVLVVLAVALIIMDSQLRVLEPVRRAVSVAIYPFQRAVMAPRDLVQQVNEWVNAANLIRSEMKPCSASASSWPRWRLTARSWPPRTRSCAACWA